jgi:sec-independent protein translocase protein TatC
MPDDDRPPEEPSALSTDPQPSDADRPAAAETPAGDASTRGDESSDDESSDGNETAADARSPDDEGADRESARRGDGGMPAAADDAAEAATTTGGPPESVEAATADASAAEPVDAPDDVGGVAGPESDEEMPLAAHIEEMMRRLAVVFLVGGLATLVVVTESTELINYFWGYHIPAPLENRPRLYGPLELPLTRLKVAGLAGVVVGLPAFVYETYRFMRPGLYANERRYYLAAVPTSLVLGGIGIAFAHFLVLPAIFSYFTTYTSDAATIAFGLAETFNLIVILLAFMAIVFQIPLFIMLAIMMDLVTRRWLEQKRLIFWGTFLGIAFLFSPDPTGMAPIIVTLTMIALFEGTLAALRWTGR